MYGTGFIKSAMSLIMVGKSNSMRFSERLTSKLENRNEFKSVYFHNIGYLIKTHAGKLFVLPSSAQLCHWYVFFTVSKWCWCWLNFSFTVTITTGKKISQSNSGKYTKNRNCVHFDPMISHVLIEWNTNMFAVFSLFVCFLSKPIFIHAIYIKMIICFTFNSIEIPDLGEIERR